MRVFVTGASGHIASAVVPALINAGHEVTGLARSETSAAAVKALGAQARLGDTSDLDGLRDAAAGADAVIHLAFNHHLLAAGDMAGATAMDMATVKAFGEALTGTGKTFIGVGLGNAADGAPAASANPRSAVAREITGFSGRGIRSMLVAIPPVVHSTRDKSGFIPTLIRIARASGVSGYAGDGANRWPAVHTLDLGRLYPLALEKAPAGSQLIAAAEEGVAVRDIAEVIGRHLGIPAVSIPAEQAMEHFGWLPEIHQSRPDAGGGAGPESWRPRQWSRLLGWARPVRPAGRVVGLRPGAGARRRTGSCRPRQQRRVLLRPGSAAAAIG